MEHTSLNGEPLLLPTPELASGTHIDAQSERGSLYRAYRSLTFDEVFGQRHVTQTLRNAVRYGKVAHAYLFTGPRGTGKTSTARILARAVNCLQPRDGEPCNSCSICVSMLDRRSLDLVEIDGASNNSVDDVRELRERVNLRPAEGRRKVFIIDEVHMLSIGAFNALLKTLEEPPDHILFALATTELQKVPATVRSRCQLLELRPIPPADMVARLRFVCASERINAGDDVLEFISAQSTGSLRDALSLLEQVRAFCGDDLPLDDVETALGVARVSIVATLAGAMAGGELAQALLIAGDLMDGGVDPRQLTRQLSGFWRDALVGRARQKPIDEPAVAKCRADQIVPVLHALMGVESATRRSDSPRWALETAIADATLTLGGGVGAHRAALPAAEIVPAPVPYDRSPRMRESEPRAATRALDGSAGDRSHPDAAPYSTPLPSMPELREDARAIDRIAFEAQARAGEGGPELASSALEALPGAAAAQVEAGSDARNFHGAGRQDLQPAGSATTGIDGDLRPIEVSQPINVQAQWPRVLRHLNENNKVLVYGLVQNINRADIITDDNVLQIPFPESKKFQRGQLEKPANRRVLEDAVRAVFGGSWGVRCVTIVEPSVVVPPNVDDLEYLEQIAAEAAGLTGEASNGA
jgi:DNA polymerase III subunit gamma/tau